MDVVGRRSGMEGQNAVGWRAVAGSERRSWIDVENRDGWPGRAQLLEGTHSKVTWGAGEGSPPSAGGSATQDSMPTTTTGTGRNWELD